MTYPIFPMPARIELKADAPQLLIGSLKNIYVPDAHRARVAAFCEAAGLALTIRGLDGSAGFILASSRTHSLPEQPAPARGYVLAIDADGLVLAAADLEGFYAGLQSLWQLHRRDEPVPAGRIVDAPRVRVRSFQIDLGRQPETLAELKRLVRQQAAFHYNECQLYIENSIKLAAFGAAADPEGLTVEELRQLQDFGAALGVDVVPSLNLLGHMEKILRHPDFAHLSEMTHGARHPYQTYGGCLCPELPESRAFIAAVVREICEASRSGKLMVGLDECWTLGSHPASRARLDETGAAGTIFRDWICFLHGEITRGDKRMWMWEDMLFYHLGSLDGIPRDVGMNIWHYQHIEEYPAYSFQDWRRIDSIKTFTDLGHPAMLCCGPAPDHLESMIRYAEGAPLDGVLVVQWEGSGVVQELFHFDRALAAGVLWSGTYPDAAGAARAVFQCDRPKAEELGDLFVRRRCACQSKGGGTAECPRFWSWPENAIVRMEQGGLLEAFDRARVNHEALEVPRAFLAARQVSVTTDVVRETAALVGRQMLCRGMKSSAVLDDAIEMLRQAAALAESISECGEAFHARYCDGLEKRPMVRNFAAAPDTPRELLRRLEAFRAAPSVDTWPFTKLSLHLDGLALDPSAHHARIAVSDDGETFHEIYAGNVRLSAMEGEFVMSLPLPARPTFVRIEVGGFAALGLTRVRLESLEGTELAKRIVAAEGIVSDPRHLLDFDRKLTIFNEPDIMKNWLSLTPLAPNYVILEF